MEIYDTTIPLDRHKNLAITQIVIRSFIRKCRQNLVEGKWRGINEKNKEIRQKAGNIKTYGDSPT